MKCRTGRSLLGWLVLGVAAIGVFPTLLGDPRPTISEESKVPPYTLPDPLVCADGTPVRDAQIWREKRRPELLGSFESLVYGKTLVGRPANLKFVVREEKKDARGGKATRMRVGVLFEGTETGRQMELLVYFPNQIKAPVPMLFGLNFDGNYTTTDEPDVPLAQHWALGLFSNRLIKNKPTEKGRGIHKEQWQYDLALEHGYAVATAGYGEVEPDANDHWKDGPRGLGPAPGTDDWGCIGAWAWAYSRAMDYFETNPRVDAKRVAALGFSRLGKTAMWAGARDERFAAVISLESGAGGVALSKRIFGETLESLTGPLGRWFTPALKAYATNEAALPIDQHELAALIAPRPLLINSAAGDLWSDPKGEFLGGLGADPVYRLLGTDGLSQKEWPAVGTLLTSRIGYFMRPGKHDVTAEDWKALVAFADKQLK
ncbi:MAG TPA: acetylxylan esterase [Candidatus Limnocylindria bacterium]|nr:acetylxylan esterase [Candidatus Limnocylindria bacterium]